MKYIFLGATKFSFEILNSLMESGLYPEAIFSIPKEFHISYSDDVVVNSNFYDLSTIATENEIPFYWVDSVPGKKITDYADVIRKIQPDVILVMGWYYMVPKKVRDIAKYGSWGIHASLLPNYAGGAPLVWAIINGEKETGVTLFRMDDGVDDGDIITQKRISILENDDIKTLYEKATNESKQILKNIFSKSEKIHFKVQDKSKIIIYPQRKPSDGEIDWNWEPQKIKNFIRAQTKPYPGAFTIINGKRVTIWDADITSE